MNLLNGGFWELFNPLNFVKHLMFMAGGGSGGGSTTAYTQTSNVPSYLKEEYKNLIGQAQQQIYNIDANGNITDEANPNGTTYNIAGICNTTKNVFGMMPHPERCATEYLLNTDGRLVFDSFILGKNALA
mgnify:CR=1 FL=1